MKTLVSILATIVATSIGQAHASIIQFDISGLDSLGPDVLFAIDFIARMFHKPREPAPRQQGMPNI